MHTKGMSRGRRPVSDRGKVLPGLPYKRATVPSWLQNPNPDVKFDKKLLKPSLFGLLLRAPADTLTGTKLLTFLRANGKHTMLGKICRGLEIVKRLG